MLNDAAGLIGWVSRISFETVLYIAAGVGVAFVPLMIWATVALEREEARERKQRLDLPSRVMELETQVERLSRGAWKGTPRRRERDLKPPEQPRESSTETTS